MAERNIKVIVRDKNASVEGSPVIICGNSDYTITFDFDTDWSLTGVRTARFVYVKGGKVQHEDVVFFADKVKVPVISKLRSSRSKSARNKRACFAISVSE